MSRTVQGFGKRAATLSIAVMLSLTMLMVVGSPAQAQQTEWVLEDVVNKNTTPVQSMILDDLGAPHIFIRPGGQPAPGNLTHFYRQGGVWYNETVTELWSLASVDAAFDALGNIHIVFNGLLSDLSTHLFYATNAGMPSGQWNVTVLSGNYLYTGAKMTSGPGNGVTFCTWDQWTSQTLYIHAVYGQPLTFENVSIAKYAPLDLCVSSDGSLHELFNDVDSYLSEAFKNETGWYKRPIDAVNRTETGAMSIDGNDRLHVVYSCSNRTDYNEVIVQYVSGNVSGWGAPMNLVPSRSAWYGGVDIDSRGDSRVALTYEYTDGIHQLDMDQGVVTSSSLIYRSHAMLKLDANYDVRLALRRGVGPELYVQYAYQREIAAPGPPTGLSAENNLANGNANLSWLAPLNIGNSSITGYAIYRGTSSGGEGATPIATIDNLTSYVDFATTLGQTYWYQVSAINSIGEGVRSDEVSVMVGTRTSAPRNLTIFSGLYSINLYWEAPLSDGGGAPLSYNVYMRTAGTPGDYEILSQSISELGWNWFSATSGLMYDFKVTCSNSFGESPASNEVSAQLSTVPGAPTLTSAAPGDAQVILTWSAPGDDGGHPVTSYIIWRGTSPNDEFELVTVGVVLTYTDTGLANGQAYYYRVMATTILGRGFASNELSATPVAMTVPSAPQDLQAIKGNGIITLTWSVPDNDGGFPIVSYKIFRGTNVVDLIEIGTSTTTQYIDAGVTPGQIYAYGVEAVNSVGNGDRTTISGIVAPEEFHYINGRVMDAYGNPIASATVSLENGSSVQSSAEGYFQILASTGHHNLTFSSSGRDTKMVQVIVGIEDLNVGTVEMVTTAMDPWVWYGLIAVAAVIAALLLIYMIWGGRKQDKEDKDKK